MSKRLHATLPDRVYQKLEGWADHEGRAIANLAAYLIQRAIEEAEEAGKLPRSQD